jgi:hypothetical protein
MVTRLSIARPARCRRRTLRAPGASMLYVGAHMVYAVGADPEDDIVDGQHLIDRLPAPDRAAAALTGLGRPGSAPAEDPATDCPAAGAADLEHPGARVRYWSSPLGVVDGVAL